MLRSAVHQESHKNGHLRCKIPTSVPGSSVTLNFQIPEHRTSLTAKLTQYTCHNYHPVRCTGSPMVSPPRTQRMADTRSHRKHRIRSSCRFHSPHDSHMVCVNRPAGLKISSVRDWILFQMSYQHHPPRRTSTCPPANSVQVRAALKHVDSIHQ